MVLALISAVVALGVGWTVGGQAGGQAPRALLVGISLVSAGAVFVAGSYPLFLVKKRRVLDRENSE